MNMDVVFITPSVGDNYQFLKSKYISIEPPTWSLLLAQSMKSFGFKVSIIDANAENLDAKKVSDRIEVLKPRIKFIFFYFESIFINNFSVNSFVS